MELDTQRIIKELIEEAIVSIRPSLIHLAHQAHLPEHDRIVDQNDEDLDKAIFQLRSNLDKLNRAQADFSNHLITLLK